MGTGKDGLKCLVFSGSFQAGTVMNVTGLAEDNRNTVWLQQGHQHYLYVGDFICVSISHQNPRNGLGNSYSQLFSSNSTVNLVTLTAKRGTESNERARAASLEVRVFSAAVWRGLAVQEFITLISHSDRILQNPAVNLPDTKCSEGHK